MGMLTMLVAAIMTISATSVTGEASRVQWFTIQNNAACNATSYISLYFNVNNVSINDANVILRLYNDAGTEVNLSGYNSSGYPTSTITPGTTFTLAGKTTAHYTAVIGAGLTAHSCSDVPAYGKIIVESDSGILLAGGEIESSRLSDGYTYNRTNITVNDGKPF